MRFEMRITCKNAAFDEYPRDKISPLMRLLKFKRWKGPQAQMSGQD